MAVLEGGVSGALAGVGAEAANPLHTVRLPVSYGSLGHYRLAMTSGTMAAGLGANSEIFQFRWTDATRLALVYNIAISAGLNVAATAAALASFRSTIARAFSAAGTGGTAATITGNNQKLRTSMGTTLLGEARCATTAALGAGTKTLDSQDIGVVAFGIGTGALTVSPGMSLIPLTRLLDADGEGQHPLVLAQNEGVIVRSGAAMPATMTWHFAVYVIWAEVAAF